MSKEQQQFPLFRTDSATQWHKIISPQQVVSIRKGNVTAIGVAEIQDREYGTLLNEHAECTEEDFTQALQDAYAQLYAQFPIKKQSDYRPHIGAELDDIIIYCHLLATREGLNLNAEVVKKFNHVSDHRGCNIKIPITGK